MAELPKELTAQIDRQSSALADMIAAQGYAKGERLEFPGSKMAAGFTMPHIDALVKGDTAVSDSFRYQLRTLKPGGLSADEIESVIKGPKGNKQRDDQILKIASDDKFYDNIAIAIGNSIGRSNVQARAKSQLIENATRAMAQETGKGVSEEDAVKAVIAKSADLDDLTNSTTHRFKLAIVQSTLLQLDGQKGLDDKQEAKLLDTNKKLYAKITEAGIFEDEKKAGQTPPTEAEYLRLFGSQKYRKEHAADAKHDIDKGAMLESATGSKEIAYLAVKGVDLKKGPAEKTDSMVATVSRSDLLSPSSIGAITSSKGLAI